MAHAQCWEHVPWKGLGFLLYHPTQGLALPAQRAWMVPSAPKQPHSPCSWQGQHCSNPGGKTWNIPRVPAGLWVPALGNEHPLQGKACLAPLLTAPPESHNTPQGPCARMGILLLEMMWHLGAPAAEAGMNSWIFQATRGKAAVKP